MTVVQPNSIAGINSITVQSGNSLAIHKSDGTLIREIVSSTGISTYSSISVGSAATDNNAGKSINIGLGASISQHADNSLSLGTNGDERFQIDSSGNVYIGGVGASATAGSLWFNDTSANASKIAQSNGNSALTFHTGSSQPERTRIDSSGRILVGVTATRSAGTTTAHLVQVEALDASSGFTATRCSANSGGPYLTLTKTRAASLGDDTVVQVNDSLGMIRFAGADGTDTMNVAASINASVDGTPGTDDMPGRLVFSTTADGANTATERLRITAAGNVDINGTPPWSVAGGDYRNLSISGQTASSSGFIWLGNGAAASNADFDVARIRFCNGGTEVAQIAASTYTSATDDGRLTFATKSTSATLAERIRIQGNGQILYSAAGGDNTITSKRTNAAGSNGNYFFHVNANNSDNNTVGSLGFHRDTAADDSRIVFSTRNTGGSNTERLRITSSGDLMINQPGEASGRLTIKGTNNSGSTCYSTGGSANAGKALEGYDVTCTTVGDGNYGGAISFGAGGNGRSAIATVQVGSDDDVNGLAFFVHESNNGTDDNVEKMRINPNGTTLQQYGTNTNLKTYIFSHANGAGGSGGTFDLATFSTGNSGMMVFAEVDCIGSYGSGNTYVHASKWITGLRAVSNSPQSWSANTPQEVGANGSNNGDVDIQWATTGAGESPKLQAVVSAWTGFIVTVKLHVYKNAGTTINAT